MPDLVILSTTLNEESFLECMCIFQSRAAERGLSCELVRYGALGLALGEGPRPLIWGPGSRELLTASLVIPRLSLRRITRGDLYLLDAMESWDVPFLNPPAAMEAARSKVTALQLLQQAGLSVPPTVIIRQPADLPQALSLLGDGPYVLKPSMGSQGAGVQAAASRAEVQLLLDEFWRQDRHAIPLLQPRLSSGGPQPHDLRILVLLGRVAGAMRRTAPGCDFRTNFSLGGTVEAVDLDPALAGLAIRAAAVLDLDLAGVDILLTPRGPVILEVNANPGWEGLAKAQAASGRDLYLAMLDILEDSFPLRGSAGGSG